MVLDQLLLLPNEGDGYAARQRCGERAGVIGIGVNLILFAVSACGNHPSTCRYQAQEG